MSRQEKIYFLSDFHLGAPDAGSSLLREKKIVEFLDEIKRDATEIFIVGDMFDFWYEYRMVVPKGHVRLLGKLAEITDAGIPIPFFAGIPCVPFSRCAFGRTNPAGRADRDLVFVLHVVGHSRRGRFGGLRRRELWHRATVGTGA